MTGKIAFPALALAAVLASAVIAQGDLNALAGPGFPGGVQQRHAPAAMSPAVPLSQHAGGIRG